jgi:hypothetical protein
MRAGPVKTVRLAQVMADKAPVWERVIARYGLKPTPFAQAALWRYGDFVFTPGYDIMSDTLEAKANRVSRIASTPARCFSTCSSISGGSA